MTAFLFDPVDLVATAEHVASMSRGARLLRLDRLIENAHERVEAARRTLIETQNRECIAIVALFSGGNDSTVLFHIFRNHVTHAMHANTGIGIEATRNFVRETCKDWGIPLIERKAPRAEDSYETLVMAEGFPGPAQHYKMFQRLKQRAMDKTRNELVKNPRKQRVLFLGGRRRTESARRAMLPDMDRRGSIVHVSPLLLWTAPDLATYRSVHPDCPRNPVSDLIHMSGECLCGAYATKDERREIESWFPGTFDVVKRLEMALDIENRVPACRRRWGWGADLDAREMERLLQRRSKQFTPMCGGACQQRMLILRGEARDAQESREANP